MIAERAEKVFQVIVGMRQVRVIIAPEQRLPIARRHLEKGCVPGLHEGVCTRAGQGVLHLMENLPIAPPDLHRRDVLLIV
jgi:hypothetical protein